MGKTDAELMMAFRSGDEASFAALVERFQVRLINHFHKLVFDRHIAEDLTQEVFLRLDQYKRNYTPVASFSTYLYRVARNCWIDHLRRTKRERGTRSLDEAGEESLSLYERIPGGGEQPAEPIAKAIHSLPDDHRQVFVMGAIDGMRYAEIAEAIEIPVGTVKSRMHTALRRLSARLLHVLPRAPKGRREEEKAETTEENGIRRRENDQ